MIGRHCLQCSACVCSHKGGSFSTIGRSISFFVRFIFPEANNPNRFKILITDWCFGNLGTRVWNVWQLIKIDVFDSDFREVDAFRKKSSNCVSLHLPRYLSAAHVALFAHRSNVHCAAETCIFKKLNPFKKNWWLQIKHHRPSQQRHHCWCLVPGKTRVTTQFCVKLRTKGDFKSSNISDDSPPFVEIAHDKVIVHNTGYWYENPDCVSKFWKMLVHICACAKNVKSCHGERADS